MLPFVLLYLQDYVIKVQRGPAPENSWQVSISELNVVAYGVGVENHL